MLYCRWETIQKKTKINCKSTNFAVNRPNIFWLRAKEHIFVQDFLFILIYMRFVLLCFIDFFRLFLNHCLFLRFFFSLAQIISIIFESDQRLLKMYLFEFISMWGGFLQVMWIGFGWFDWQNAERIIAEEDILFDIAAKRWIKIDMMKIEIQFE